MIGTLDRSSNDVTIVGGGFSGLVTAYYLDRAGWKVTLHEAESRVGGLIRTEKTPWGISESAAHSFLVTPQLAELCRDVGVELLPFVNGARYIWRNGRMRRFPLSTFGAFVAFLRAYFLLSKPVETLEEWGFRHLGREATRYLLEPGTRGIFASEPDKVSVEAVFPRLVVPRGHSLLSFMIHRWRTERRKPRNPMMAPSEGMGFFIEALRRRLRDRLGERFRENSKVTALPASGNVILCVPADESAKLLQKVSPVLARHLENVRYVPLVSVTAFGKFKQAAHGVGVLFPRDSQRKVLGVLFNSSAFQRRVEKAGNESYTVMLGGTSWPEALSLADEELRNVVQSELREILGDGSVEHFVTHRWERAIPLYDRHLLETWNVARQTWCMSPGRVLFGNYAGQVGLRGLVEAAHKLAGGLQLQANDEHLRSSFDPASAARRSADSAI